MLRTKTLMLVVWWHHQNKAISFCFNTVSFCCLTNPWWLPFVKETICEPLDPIKCWWLKLRANEPIITLVLDTRWRNQNGSIFLNFLFFILFFFLRKYWWLKTQHIFLSGEGNDNRAIITPVADAIFWWTITWENEV